MADYLLVNDVHLADRPPSNCTDAYLADLFDLVDAVNHLAAARESAGIIYAGDLFHIKTPGRTSHAVIMRTISLFRDAPCQVYVVPGNHDMQHDRLESIWEGQPLGVVFASEAAYPLLGNNARTDGLTRDHIYGVPWLKRFDDDTVTDALADWRHDDTDGVHGLVVAHAPLYPPGRELPYEFYPAHAWAAAMGGSGTVHYGHVHERHGIYTVDGVVFSNPGALSRGSLDEHNLSRDIRIASWDPRTGTIEHVGVAHKPADQVFRIAEAAKVKEHKLSLAGFLDAVSATRLDISSTASVLAHIHTLDLDPGLLTVLTDLLTEEVSP